MFRLGGPSLEEAVRKIDSDGPLFNLYTSSKNGSKHFEDQKAYDEVGEYRQRLEQADPGSRCEAQTLWKRLQLTQDLAQDLCSNFKCVEGVVLLGSALRGKASPRDFDLVVLTTPQDPDLKLLNKYPIEKYNVTEIAKLERYLLSRYPELGGIRTEITVEFAVNRWAGMLNLIKKGPYFCYVRSGRKVCNFTNLDSTEYASSRLP